MKRLILFVGLLSLVGGALAGEIGIIKQFNNRIPALRRFKVDGLELRDFNRDDVQDIAIFWNDTMMVINPLTKGPLWRFNIKDITTGSITPPNFLGFLDMEGQNATTHAAFFGDDNGVSEIVDVRTNQITFSLANSRPLAVLAHPQTGKHIIAVELDGGRKVAIIGESGGNSTTATIASHRGARIGSFSGDYQLELKFQAEPGLRLAYDPDLFDPRHDLDINGDEKMDIPMLIENASNELVGVVVRGGDSLGVLWQFPFPPEHKANILKGFHGFVDVNADGEKEAIFGQNLAVTLDGSVHTIAEDFITIDVNDIDGDGFEEIIGLNTTDSTVVVYGAMSATAIEGYDPAAIYFQLFQNYPNPFNPNTTISYTVAQTANVEMIIFNQLGQAVRELFRGQKPPGKYSVNWDGRDDARRLLSSSLYFYRLKVDDAVQTRRMLFLK